MIREAFYFDHAPFLSERLTPVDIRALDGEEDQWLRDAADVLSPGEYKAAVSQWQQWLAQEPAYRLLAYYDGFGGYDDDVPLILSQITGWSPSTIPDQTMIALFGKAEDAVQHGSLAGTQGANPATTPQKPPGGIGMVALLAVGLFFLLKKR